MTKEKFVASPDEKATFDLEMESGPEAGTEAVTEAVGEAVVETVAAGDAGEAAPHVSEMSIEERGGMDRNDVDVVGGKLMVRISALAGGCLRALYEEARDRVDTGGSELVDSWEHDEPTLERFAAGHALEELAGELLRSVEGRSIFDVEFNDGEAVSLAIEGANIVIEGHHDALLWNWLDDEARVVEIKSRSDYRFREGATPEAIMQASVYAKILGLDDGYVVTLNRDVLRYEVVDDVATCSFCGEPLDAAKIAGGEDFCACGKPVVTDRSRLLDIRRLREGEIRKGVERALGRARKLASAVESGETVAPDFPEGHWRCRASRCPFAARCPSGEDFGAVSIVSVAPGGEAVDSPDSSDGLTRFARLIAEYDEAATVKKGADARMGEIRNELKAVLSERGEDVMEIVDATGAESVFVEDPVHSVVRAGRLEVAAYGAEPGCSRMRAVSPADEHHATGGLRVVAVFAIGGGGEVRRACCYCVCDLERQSGGLCGGVVDGERAGVSERHPVFDQPLRFECGRG